MTLNIYEKNKGVVLVPVLNASAPRLVLSERKKY